MIFIYALNLRFSQKMFNYFYMFSVILYLAPKFCDNFTLQYMNYDPLTVL
jgi:hypothetical protein